MLSWVHMCVCTSVSQKEGGREGEREHVDENITIGWACVYIKICISLLHFRLFVSTSFYIGVVGF